MSYLRALVLLVISAVVVVAVPAVTSATTPGPDDPGTSAASEASAAAEASTAPPTTTPPPTTTAPPTTAPATTTPPTPARLTVESERSVTYYRERGVPVSASGLDVEDASTEPNASLRFDGELLQDLFVVDGAFEVSTTFPVTTPGDHLVTVTAGDRLLASTTVDVLRDLYAVSAKPSWITAEKLATDGVTLSAREVPPSRPVTAYLGDNPPVTRTSVDDGTISITIRNTDDSSLEEPGVSYGVLETEDGELSSVAVRTTVLGVTVRGTSGELRATGFEPGTDVTLTSSRGQQTTTADADGAATFSLPAFVGEVTAAGTAGSVTVAVDTNPTTPPTAGISEAEMRRIAAQAAAVDTARAAALDMAKAIEAVRGKPGPLPATAQEALDAQLLAYQQIMGAVPQVSPVKVGKPGVDDSREKREKLAEDQKKLITETKASERKVVDAAESAAAEALATYADARKEQQEVLDEMITKIIQFVKDLNEAKSEQMRALTRASTLELVSVGPLDAVRQVSVPVGFTGRHHVGTIEPSSGLLLAWQPFDVAASTATSPGAIGSGALPDAGASVTPALLALGAGLLAAGAVLVARRRRAA